MASCLCCPTVSQITGKPGTRDVLRKGTTPVFVGDGSELGSGVKANLRASCYVVILPSGLERK